MVWGAIAGSIAGGILAGQASKDAAGTAAGAQQAGIAEQRRQFDISQEQQKPWLEAGKGALGRYEEMLGQRGEYEGQIRSDVPGQFQYGGQVPGAYQGQAGEHFGRIQSDVQPGFQFGREEFEQYKDPGYDFRREEGLRALERKGAATGQRMSGYGTRSLMELGQGLASQEFGAARERAMGDYQSRVAREQQTYGRGVSDYERRTGRESELYGRGRQQRLDEVRQEQEQYGRGLRGYGLDVERERAQYGRDIDRYGRTYLDPMAREAGLAGVGQATAQNLGQLGAGYSQNISGMIGRAGTLEASGQLGAAGAYAGALGDIGRSWDEYSSGPEVGGHDVWGEPI